MKVKELIEKLKEVCPEFESIDVCFFNEHWLMDVEKVEIKQFSSDGETRIVLLLDEEVCLDTSLV